MRPLIFTRLLSAVSLVLSAALPALARETVLEDSPSRLVLEVEVPAPVLKDGLNGQSVVVPGFGQADVVGAPALPRYGFQVATGSRMPSVSIEALEWVEIDLPQGLAGVPRPISPRESEPAHDPALFAAAGGLSPQVSDFQMYRGLRLRTISMPIATWSDGSGRARVLKKFRVTATFGGSSTNISAAPAAGVRPWLVQADVKNVNGGQYLVSMPRKAQLRRSAAAQLSSGSFLKIKVGDRTLDGFDEDGVYALSYDAAKQAAPSILGADTRKLRLYSGPNDVLDVSMGSILAPTLREIPIEVVDVNADDTFNDGDKILFYAHGTSLWKPIVGSTGPVKWQFANDPYSFENYYYLDWSGAVGGARLQTEAFTPASTTVTMAPHYLRGEKEAGTGSCDPSHAFDAETGYDWFWYWKGICSAGSPGPGFTTLTPTLTAAQLRSAPADTLKQRVADSTVWFGAFTYSGSGDEFEVYAGSDTLSYENLGIPGAWYPRIPAANAGDGLGIDRLDWTGGARRFNGYTVRYMRRLAWAGAPRRVFPAATGERVAYRIDSAASVAGLRVLRIEAGVARKALTLQAASGAMIFSDSAGAGEDVYYLVYQNTLTLAANAVSVEAVSLTAGVIQNLETGDEKNPEYVILAPQALLSEAVALRNYRDDAARSTSSKRWNTVVVRTEDVYREWSGGRLSPVALRDFLRWAVNRWGAGRTPGNLKYVVLYGDGHYDYRNIRNASSNAPLPNNIPPFNWDFGDGNPMSSDDFYATLDSAESWVNPGLDIAVGRLPFQTRDHARAYLEKIKRYEDPATAGEWRSRFLLTGDDDRQRDAVDGIFDHTQQAEDLGNHILSQDSGMRKEQVYLFDYPRNSSYLKPEATQAMMDFYNRGVLFSTFFGHGAYNQMADEVLLKTNDGLGRFRNTDKFFLMSIFSCTVGRFDKLADEGMSEQFLRVANLGAISAISASRESYDDPNAALGNQFVLKLFDSSTDSIARPVGEALRLAKNSVGLLETSLNKQKYILQGEPVTLIHRPGLGVELDSVPQTMQALGCDTLRGRVNQGSGKGRVNLRIVTGDVPKTYTTHIPSPGGDVRVKKPGKILFERTVDYQNSEFSIGYFLPKTVPFGDTGAKIQVFAWDAEQLRESAVLIANRHIDGTANCVVDLDKRGPRIAVTGCNTKESGGVDFPDKIKISLPYCLQISVRDTVGGVLSGTGPNEGTTVEVVGSVPPFHPQAGVDDLYLKTYQVTLTNQDLVPGTHTFKVQARDGFGNIGEREMSLQVAQDSALRFIKAFNVPNPMKRSGTTFHFQTTLPSEEGGALTSPRTDRINFHLRIFNQQGYMVREFRDAVSGETRWDGKDAWGRQLANGVYFYQVTGSWSEGDGAPGGGRQVSKKNVLVISR